MSIDLVEASPVPSGTPEEERHYRAAGLLAGISLMADAISIATAPTLHTRLLVLAAGICSATYGVYRLLRQWHTEMGRAVLMSILLLSVGTALVGGVAGTYVRTATPSTAAQASIGGSGQSTPTIAPSGDRSLPASATSQPSASPHPSDGSTTRATYLADLTPVGRSDFVGGSWSVNDHTYDHSVASTKTGCLGSTATADYNLDRRYTQFQVTVGPSDDALAGAPMTFTLALDGNIVWQQPLRLGQAVPITKTIAGVFRLEISAVTLCDAPGAAVFGDAQLS
jgi:hypothetical protein